MPVQVREMDPFNPQVGALENALHDGSKLYIYIIHTHTQRERERERERERDTSVYGALKNALHR